MYHSKCGSRDEPKGMGEFPSGQWGQTVNLLSDDFGGSNPPSPTKKDILSVKEQYVFFITLLLILSESPFFGFPLKR